MASTVYQQLWDWGNNALTPDQHESKQQSLQNQNSREEASKSSNPNQLNQSQATDSTKSSHSSQGNSPAATPEANISIINKVDQVWNKLQSQVDSAVKNHTKNGTTVSKRLQFLDFVEEVCSPCKPEHIQQMLVDEKDEPNVGICRLEEPSWFKSLTNISLEQQGKHSDDASTETPVDRRLQRYKERQRKHQQRLESSQLPWDCCEGTSKLLEQKISAMPLESLILDTQNAVELERSISELTMKSSHGQAISKLAANRRMAYYAVGKHHRQSGRGGNRRCYFTGNLILGGAPFYAGCVQQGLRTLVVFCLPSALELPKQKPPSSHQKSHSRRIFRDSKSDSVATESPGDGANFKSRTGSLLSRRGSRSSGLSSLDGMSLSVEEELDSNWGLDRDYLLSVLPEPEQALLDEIAKQYPTQYETLPLQVRSPNCWGLYFKFCFFSGLPIAEGELHYKVQDELVDECGEEVILSHEVMEAVNGESAEILRLPNLKTFQYLRKHYSQQSGKLPDAVFQRQAWEMIRPEI